MNCHYDNSAAKVKNVFELTMDFEKFNLFYLIFVDVNQVFAIAGLTRNPMQRSRMLGYLRLLDWGETGKEVRYTSSILNFFVPLQKFLH
ncbi:hypothetical protein [Candidatus Symbiothrix dinenymphae]|uniref:hypothetical protein n=1 Tax=Candidatus Symbiothrix dinenymphae TaxID=467085 RepID=UPI0006E44992|nr:hypothetical protein [Candidatus Symbiothrix dinenymphae]